MPDPRQDTPPSAPPATLASVTDALDAIVADAIACESARGYFAALYARVTGEVARGIAAGAFQDGERMARRVVVFAARYLAAERAYRRGEDVPESWRTAFEAEDRPALTALQHLLLGMNAHINLDLGIAAAEVACNDPMALKTDFLAINAILGRQIDGVQDRLARFVRHLRLVDRLLGSIDEQLSMFSIGYARDKAWTQTLELAATAPAGHGELIRCRDDAVAAFASRLIRPRSWLIRLCLVVLRLFERGATGEKIRQLAATHPD